MMLISMAGLISFMGYDGTVYLMGWTGGYVLLALCLAPYLRKYGAFTVPDFVGDRDGREGDDHRVDVLTPRGASNGGPSATISPSRIMITRSQRCSASSM